MLIDQPEPVAGLATARSLRESAYDFIAESLLLSERADGTPRLWKFAVILAAQGVELLLKARLAIEHPLLLRSNPDRLSDERTVTVESALNRLAGAGVVLGDDEIRRIRGARALRNQFTHFTVDAPEHQVRSAYVDLIEFCHAFHESELDGELHPNLPEDVWAAEAVAMAQFRREMVLFQGSEVISWYPHELLADQFLTRVTGPLGSHARIRRGDPDDYLNADQSGPCHNCAALVGQLHAFACEAERCPQCRGQLLSCGCELEPVSADQIDSFLGPGGG